MKKYWAELIGTFILVFVGTGAIMINDITGSGDPTYLWVYIVATTLGAILAVYACKLIQSDGCCKSC